jgi:hypothetical protein
MVLPPEATQADVFDAANESIAYVLAGILLGFRLEAFGFRLRVQGLGRGI